MDGNLKELIGEESVFLYFKIIKKGGKVPSHFVRNFTIGGTLENKEIAQRYCFLSN